MLLTRVKGPHAACSSAGSDSGGSFGYQNAVCVFHAGRTSCSTRRPFPGIPFNSFFLVGISLVGSKVSSKLWIEEEGGRGVKLLVGQC